MFAYYQTFLSICQPYAGLVGKKVGWTEREEKEGSAGVFEFFL